MPSAPLLHLAALTLCLASLPASAQQPSWVDPPAKPPSADPAQTSVRSAPDEPAKSAEQVPPRREAEPPAGKSEVVASERSARPNGMAAPTRAEARSKPARDENDRAGVQTPQGPAAARRPSEPSRTVTVQSHKSELEEAARNLAEEYLATVSGGTMVEAVPRFYGSWVRFHDRLLSLPALIAEKRRFVRRWPERRYEPQGVLHAACSESARTCIVRSRVSFDAASDRQGRRAKGIAEITLTINLTGQRPRIVAETSRVLRRDLASSAAVGIMQAG